MTPLGERLLRSAIRASRTVAAREPTVIALAELLAGVLEAEGLTPEPTLPPEPLGRPLTAAELKRRQREHERDRDRHGERDTQRDRAAESHENRVTMSRDNVTFLGGKGGDLSLDLKENKRERERESDVTMSRDTRDIGDPDSGVILASGGAMYSLRADFVLTAEMRAAAEMAGVVDVPGVFDKFRHVAVEKAWRFNAAGWLSRWERFWAQERTYQQQARDRGRTAPRPAAVDPAVAKREAEDRQRRDAEIDERFIAARKADAEQRQRAKVAEDRPPTTPRPLANTSPGPALAPAPTVAELDERRAAGLRALESFDDRKAGGQ